MNRTCLTVLALINLLSCANSERYPDKQIFYYNESAGVSSLDPAFANNLENIWWVSQLYNGLVQMDSNLQVIPSIAESWDISENGMTYTFHLKRDVSFHENDLIPPDRFVNSKDFVYSFDRIVKGKIASPGLWIFDKLDTERPYIALDDHTLQINLKRPFPPFLGMLSMPYCYVVPKEVVDHYGDEFRSHPVGTGPFRFNFWLENVSLALLKNEKYFEKDENGIPLPYLDAVSVSFVPDKSTAFLDFLKGRYDMMSGVYKEYRNELLTSKGELAEAYSNKIYLQRQAFLKTDYLGVRIKGDSIQGDPLQDYRIRKAMDLALDKVQMVRYIKSNTAIPAQRGFVPPACFIQEKESSSKSAFDLDSAATLLKEAGYPQGKGIPEITLSSTSDYVELCEYVQFQLGEIGLPVKVDILPTSAHRSGVSAGEIPFFRKSWIADYSDPENFLALFYSKNAAPKGANYTHYSSAEFDRLFDLSMSEVDPIKRDSLYHIMNEIIQDEAPVIPLYYDMVMRFVHKNVTGLRSNAMNHLDLRYVRKSK
ncbi:MAG: ABC transporter substrate-binding protein [Flavobacteriales bacterium]|nr:ABC transporter substrate-binding protein [Flavobacteriales bacterium]